MTQYQQKLSGSIVAQMEKNQKQIESLAMGSAARIRLIRDQIALNYLLVASRNANEFA